LHGTNTERSAKNAKEMKTGNNNLVAPLAREDVIKAIEKKAISGFPNV
jgi:hypothetical protein